MFESPRERHPDVIKGKLAKRPQDIVVFGCSKANFLKEKLSIKNAKGNMSMHHIKRPILVVSGALGVGKSTISQILIARKSNKYIILKGDLCNVVASPEAISDCRKTWVDICFDIANQTNRAVVFCTDLYPDAFCKIDKEKHKHMYFSSIVCDDEELKKRIESRYGEASDQRMPGSDKTWCEMSTLRNQVYSGRTKYQYPEMDCLVTTGLSAEQSADLLDQWITRILANYRMN